METALGDFIILAGTAEQTTPRARCGSCRTDAFTLQTGNILLINRNTATSIGFDRFPGRLPSLSVSCLWADRSTWRSIQR